MSGKTITSIALSTLVGLLTPALAGELKLGKPVEVKETTRIAVLLESPETYVGKTVRVEGQITESCQKMQCWIRIREGAAGPQIQVKVEDGEILFPRDSAGKSAIAQGQVVRVVLDRDQYAAYLQHEAREQGKDFDPATVTEGKTIYRLQGHGVIIR